MHGSIFCHCHCSSSGSLIIGAQIAHINDGEGKLALFSTKGKVLLTPIPSYFSTINLWFLFYFYFPSTMSIPHRPYIDPTSIQHRPHQPYIDPTSSPHRPHTQLLCQHSSVNSEVIYHHHLYISIVFPPPRPHNSCHRVSSLRETRMFLRLLCCEQVKALKFLLGETVYK